MPYTLSPEVEVLVREKLAAGEYQSEDEVLREAIWALDEIGRRHEVLRAEVQARLARADRDGSQPLDREAFKAEMRRRFAAEK